jgi:hypothetical protein
MKVITSNMSAYLMKLDGGDASVDRTVEDPGPHGRESIF